jgi:hypothetical protein
MRVFIEKEEDHVCEGVEKHKKGGLNCVLGIKFFSQT